MEYLPIILCISVLSLIVAALLARHVLAADTGTPAMQEISNAIKEGHEVMISVAGGGPNEPTLGKA